MLYSKYLWLDFCVPTHIFIMLINWHILFVKVVVLWTSEIPFFYRNFITVLIPLDNHSSFVRHLYMAWDFTYQQYQNMNFNLYKNHY